MHRSRRFILLAGLAVSACGSGQPPGQSDPRQRPLVIVVSLDGFRWDYLERPPAARLRTLASQGIRLERLVPAFPTKTFPNHYTLATGLFPAHHGIVANTMTDSVLGRFTTADTAGNRQPGWWRGEPIWITARRQGLRSATMFWTGSEVAFNGLRPNLWRPFDANLPMTARIDQALTWLGLPADRRPDLLMVYLNRVDVVGHKFGPDHPAVDSAIATVDSAVGRLVDGLDSLGLRPQTDLVVVSDHGMTSISPDRVIFLDDYVELSPGDVVDLAPVTGLSPDPARVATVVRQLAGAHPHLAVFRREDVPPRFRFSQGDRVTPVVAIADDGWTISTRAQWKTRPMTDLGNHGYDHELASMAAMLIAIGPDFRQGMVAPPMQNVHLYELLAHLLHIRPAPNDGSFDSVRALLR